MTEKSQQLSNKLRHGAGVCSIMLPIEIALAPQISIKILTLLRRDTEMVACTVHKQCFKMSSRTHDMDNRFPRVEREAWIILFIVNTGEA